MRWLGGILALALTACGSDSGDTRASAGASGDSSAMGGANNGGAGNGSSGAGTNQAGMSNGGANVAGSPGTAGSAAAPDTKWVNVTGNLPALAAMGAKMPPGDLSFLTPEPGTARVIAGVAWSGLFATTDGGKTWSKLGTGSGSASINHGPTSITFDPDHPGVFWESGIYGDGIFHTSNAGETFERLGDISHNDYLSVDLSDPARRLLVAGAHEATQKLFRSTNGGMTWEDIGSKLPAGSSFSTLPFILDTMNWVVGSAQGGGTWGVFRTADGGQTWTTVSPEGPAGWPLKSKDGAIYWVLAGDKGMITSTDAGKSWSKTAPGPVQSFSAGPVELPDGRIVTLGMSHLLVTSDKGKTWQELGEALPFPGGNCKTYGFTYSAALKAFFINHNDCSGKLTNDAVWSSGFDYEAQ
jgi:photosystem II stability/assembly factor-like uncharacterized protein